ncbi:MAG: cation:proton antiporter [Phycisphaerales bacterium]|nr:cation:proton antiporter [Phycisphaerales bacterium]
MKTLARLLAVLLMLLLAIGVLRHFTPGYASARYLDAMNRPFSAPEYDLVATTTTLAFILIGAWLTGKVFKLLHLPRITGYLAFGLLIGPSFITLFTADIRPILPKPQMEHLRVFSSLAIVLIGLTAGGEIKIELLRRGLGRVLGMLTIVIVAVLSMVFIGLFLGRGLLGFLGELPRAELIVVCLMAAVLATSNSPAVLVAMLSELSSSGPMSETSLAVTVVKDLVVVVLFTIASGIGVSILLGGEAASQGTIIKDLAWHLLGSIGGGALLGALMSTVLHRLSRHMLLFVLAMSLGIVLVSESAHFEPLLVALSAGFILSNLWPEQSEELFHSVDEVSLPVYCIFFAMAGAKIDLAALGELWPLALALVALRSAAVWGGITLGSRVFRMPSPARNWIWTAFIPQAGVSLALATTIESLFRDFTWSASLSSLLLATIAIFECFGPILLRLGLIKAGETSG